MASYLTNAPDEYGRDINVGDQIVFTYWGGLEIGEVASFTKAGNPRIRHRNSIEQTFKGPPKAITNGCIKLERL